MTDFVTYGLIGDPVRQSFSPTVMNTFFQLYNLNAAFITITVRKGELKKFIAETIPQLGMGGFTITMPQKEDILPFLTGMSDAARQCGACNAVRVCEDGTLYGGQTDGAGAVKALKMAGVTEFANKKIVIFGAGGVSKGMAQAFQALGADVWILSRDITKAERIARQITGIHAGDSGKVREYMPYCDVYINGSPLGMTGYDEYPDFDFLDFLPKSATVLDAVYKPLETKLLKEARKRNLNTAEGLMMSIRQMGLLFEVLTGILPNEEAMDIVTKKGLALLSGSAAP